MKRPSMTIGGRPASPEHIRVEVSGASAAWLRALRGEKAASAKRRHRARSEAEKEAKAIATAHAKRVRQAEREAREFEKLHARIAYLSRRSDREAEAMLRVRVGWKASAQPKVTSVCPHRLYSRLHLEISTRTASVMKRSRIAADGFKNIVLRKIPRGYGRKAEGTRPYRPGEAADLARYTLREEALETGITACFSNIIETQGEHALHETETLTVDDRRCGQIVGFWDALEAFEAEADADGNVYSHLIIAMPHELSPEGRSKAMEDFCFRLDALHLPFVAALHRPDDAGDIRNFHAHVIMATRPFAIEGPFDWSFEAGKATELNLPAGIGWLRKQAAEAFNHALEREKSPLRYSGESQARRGVPSTGDTHDGPALTARKRKAQKDQAERDRAARSLAAHVARGMERQDELAAQIAVEANRKPPEVRKPSTELPAALAALRGRFPDPARLRGLSALDFEEFTPTDRAADRWYAPAYNLMVELRRGSDGLVRDRGGKPELVKEALKPEYLSLLDAPLPDIVQQELIEAHRRIVNEQQRETRIRREKEQIRKQRMTWLRGAPVPLFDADANVLPEYRELFPKEVTALEGVRQAMLGCHIAAMKQQDRPMAAAAEAEQSISRSDQTAPGTSVELDAEDRSPEEVVTAEVTPGSQAIVEEASEDEAWDQILQGVGAGLVQVKGIAGAKSK